VTERSGEVAHLAAGQPLPLARPPGEHKLRMATRTPYGTLAAQPLEYTTR
jgi:hypothetical protein